MGKQIRTMEEFAVLAGLSRPTVSRYFNDAKSVSRPTREVIEAALMKSGFRPSLFAVNLNRRRSNIIGVIVPNLADPFMRRSPAASSGSPARRAFPPS